MLGHYINVQPEKVWDHWLTKPFRPGNYWPGHGEKCGCLVGERHMAMYGKPGDWLLGTDSNPYWSAHPHGLLAVTGHRFDFLCERFGTERIQRAVRNRVLTMMAFKSRSVSGEPAVSLSAGLGLVESTK